VELKVIEDLFEMSQMLKKADNSNFYKAKFTSKVDREKEFLHEFNTFLY